MWSVHCTLRAEAQGQLNFSINVTCNSASASSWVYSCPVSSDPLSLPVFPVFSNTGIFHFTLWIRSSKTSCKSNTKFPFKTVYFLELWDRPHLMYCTTRRDGVYLLQFLYRLFLSCQCCIEWNDTDSHRYLHHCPLRLHFLFVLCN